MTTSEAGRMREAAAQVARWSQYASPDEIANAILAIPLPAPDPRDEALRIAREALEFYREHGAGCRRITSDGDISRRELDRDGGKRAEAALAALNAIKGKDGRG